MVKRMADASREVAEQDIARQYGVHRKTRRIKDAVARRKPRKTR
jgi:hypothetical protein